MGGKKEKEEKDKEEKEENEQGEKTKEKQQRSSSKKEKKHRERDTSRSRSRSRSRRSRSKSRSRSRSKSRSSRSRERERDKSTKREKGREKSQQKKQNNRERSRTASKEKDKHSNSIKTPDASTAPTNTNQQPSSQVQQHVQQPKHSHILESAKASGDALLPPAPSQPDVSLQQQQQQYQQLQQQQQQQQPVQQTDQNTNPNPSVDATQLALKEQKVAEQIFQEAEATALAQMPQMQALSDSERADAAKQNIVHKRLACLPLTEPLVGMQEMRACAHALGRPMPADADGATSVQAGATEKAKLNTRTRSSRSSSKQQSHQQPGQPIADDWRSFASMARASSILKPVSDVALHSSTSGPLQADELNKPLVQPSSANSMEAKDVQFEGRSSTALLAEAIGQKDSVETPTA